MSTRRDLHPGLCIRIRAVVPHAVVLAAVTIVLFGSCVENATEPTGPAGSPSDPQGSLSEFEGTVSEPIGVGLLVAFSVAQTSYHQVPSVPGSVDESVSFVSLQPRSMPGADSVQILNLTSGARVSTLVVDGGFDPVTIPATVGDTLEILPFETQVPQPAFRWVVPVRRPPVVVRTQPPNGKTMVPLNASVVIVFSEPIASGTSTADNIRLLRDGQVVPADIALDGERLRVELRPEVPLSPGTDYTLAIDPGVADLSGDQLEQGTEVTFSTTDATLSVTPEAVSIAVGVRLQLTVRLTDSRGGSETLPPVIWFTSDPSVAEVSAVGAVTGVGVGSTSVSATIEGQEAGVTVTVVATSITTFAQLAAGRSHTCGLAAAGNAHCWGSNEYGQLGNGAGGAGVTQLQPVPVADGHAFVMLAAGTHHTCGLTTSGRLLCWGRNDQGQLGDGSQTDRNTPTPIVGADAYVAATAGLNHTCARTASDTYCWGRNVDNVLGDWAESSSPRRVDTRGGLTRAPIALDARRQESDSHWCPIIVTSTPERGIAVWCWGQPREGRIALDLATLSSIDVTGSFADFVELRLEWNRTCSVTLGGGAYCTGYYSEWTPPLDFEHENGLGVEVCAGTRCSVPGFDVSYWYIKGKSSPDPLDLGIGLLVNGVLHSCGLTFDGRAYCWGAADRGQLGRPATDLIGDPRWDEEVGVPDPVQGDLSFATLTAGEQHTCGVSRTGETYCWGANGFGQLGDGTQVDRDEPVRVTFLE